MKDIDELRNYGVEDLSGVLKDNLHTKASFKEIAEIIGEISTLIIEESERTINIREF